MKPRRIMISVEDELKVAVTHLKEFEKKKKVLRTHRLSINYCNRMIPFLRGRISGLAFAKFQNKK